MEREDQPPRKTRRHFPTAYKRQMVEETFEPNASVSIMALQHDVNANHSSGTGFTVRDYWAMRRHHRPSAYPSHDAGDIRDLIGGDDRAGSP